MTAGGNGAGQADPPDRFDPAAAADALIGRTIAALSGGSAVGAPSTGRSASERVTATLAADGTVQELELDPRVLRGTPEVLAAEIVEAVNAAVDARPPASGAARARHEELRAVQEESLVQARQTRAALEAELDRLVEEAQ